MHSNHSSHSPVHLIYQRKKTTAQIVTTTSAPEHTNTNNISKNPVPLSKDTTKKVINDRGQRIVSGPRSNEKVYRTFFECRCCGFYSEMATIFNQHLSTESHKTRVLRNAVVAKPFWCTFCKISIDTGLNFSTHLNSKRHKAKIRAHH